MRGVLGGLFDPIHFGHCRLALEFLSILGLTEVRLVPCGHPAHRAPPRASAEHRWNMVRLVADGAKLVADDRELRRPGPSYTYDTLRSLKDEDSNPLCLLVGADALGGLPSWRRAEDLIQLCHVAALARPGSEMEASLPDSWKARCVREPEALRRSPCGRIYLHQGTPRNFSSSQIRDRIRSGASPRYCVPGSVWAYIRRHRLYLD